MNYTLHQLQIFLKIAELKSITKASEALYLTQPAVSIQLKKFQDQFSIPLTEIVGRQLYVTDFGQEIAEAAQTILEQVEQINYKSQAFQGQISGKLKISIVSTAKYLMPYFLSEFMQQNPAVDLNMNVTNKATVVDSLENNEVDFAMVSVIPDQIKLERVELMQNKLFLVGGRRYESDGRPSGKKVLTELPLIYREKGSATRAAMEEFISKNKLPTYKKFSLQSNEALKQAVISGIGYSIMPLIGIKNDLSNGDLQIIPYKGLPVKTNWNLVWRSAKKLSPVAQAYLDYVNANKDRIINDTFDWFENY
ncbi:LysR substrate-binding domain-containing protein [Gilvibacter sediminis]|uniref:LysR substrate-binding domain-containing protein n=1 Tax=Gilvibacter sediminis TaxID=379071 RepID=UPI0023509D49|nr:LysR substrate-binding domain-containing protein [Gilvibacter sediminis]MDC7998933.1 LysR substrate-binding domain-containing protein [Gilvibacter sediminis]